MGTYKKKLGLFSDSAVRKEIAILDAKKDAQRIAHLLWVYEFPWEFQRALEVALYYTYGSDSVSRLLDRTGEMSKAGQKRYDDTAILIGLFIESGWDGDFGRRAIDRMNKTHGNYTIPNDDYLFVLWTFIEFPIWWTDNFGNRPMSDHEKLAWFSFWIGVGEQMNLKSIPQTKAEFDSFVRKYEDVHFVYNEASRRVSDATVNIMENWFPTFIRPLIKVNVRALMPQKFLDAVGYKPAPPAVKAMTFATLSAIGKVAKTFPFMGYPALMKNRKERTYPTGYVVEAIEPVHLQRAREKAEAADKNKTA